MTSIFNNDTKVNDNIAFFEEISNIANQRIALLTKSAEDLVNLGGVISECAIKVSGLEKTGSIETDEYQKNKQRLEEASKEYDYLNAEHSKMVKKNILLEILLAMEPNRDVVKKIDSIVFDEKALLAKKQYTPDEMQQIFSDNGFSRTILFQAKKAPEETLKEPEKEKSENRSEVVIDGSVLKSIGAKLSAMVSAISELGNKVRTIVSEIDDLIQTMSNPIASTIEKKEEEEILPEIQFSTSGDFIDFGEQDEKNLNREEPQNGAGYTGIFSKMLQSN